MTTLIFTKNNTCLSRLIRWGLGEDVSHMGIVFDKKVVFHSNLYGTHLKWLINFIKKNDIVHIIDVPLSLQEEEEIFLRIPQYDEKWYDFGALFYFLWRGLLYKLFSTPIPKTNIFGHSDQFLCTELAKMIDPSLDNLEMTSPYQVYLYFQGKYGNSILSE